jgi:hypothetical protein
MAATGLMLKKGASVMFRLFLAPALVWHLLPGFPTAIPAPHNPVPAAQSAQAREMSSDVDFYDDGPFDSLAEAIAYRDAVRDSGLAANVITKSDGYYVRVFER